MHVLIVGVRRLFADALARALGMAAADIGVTAVADLPAAATFCSEHHADVVLLDDRPSLSPARAIRSLRPLAADGTRLLLFTSADWPQARARARAAGLDGAVSKLAPLEDVIMTLRARKGQPAARPSRPSRTRPAPKQHRCRSDHRLTPREYDVMCELTRGVDNATIAQRLGIQPSTARTHVQNILTKLDVSSRLEAATHALHHDLGPSFNTEVEHA